MSRYCKHEYELDKYIELGLNNIKTTRICKHCNKTKEEIIESGGCIRVSDLPKTVGKYCSFSHNWKIIEEVPYIDNSYWKDADSMFRIKKCERCEKIKVSSHFGEKPNFQRPDPVKTEPVKTEHLFTPEIMYNFLQDKDSVESRTCNFCNNTFKTYNGMIRHQNTAKYCIIIQNKNN